MVHIHVCLVRFVRFGTHLWLNFDLKAAAEPTGLLQRRAGDPTHRLEDPLSHLLHDKTAVIITAAAVSFRAHHHNGRDNTTHLQISRVLLVLQVWEPVDEVVENSARQDVLMNVLILQLENNVGKNKQ